MPIYLIIAIAVAFALIVAVIAMVLKLYGHIVQSRADRKFAVERARREALWRAVTSADKVAKHGDDAERPDDGDKTGAAGRS